MTVGYVRLSEKDFEKTVEESSFSIFNQKMAINLYAKNMNLTIDKFYVDDGFSGINFDRPGFDELKNDIEMGKIKTVIVKDLSRLGREHLETGYYISDYFPKNKIRFIAIYDEYDSDNLTEDQKEFILAFKTIINDNVVKQASIKRKIAAEQQTNNKFYISCYATYGYKIITKDGRRTLEIDDYSASIVKRIFTEAASGINMNEIASKLNEEGILCPAKYLKQKEIEGKCYDWTRNTIRRIIKNKIYTGVLIKRKSISLGYKVKKRKYIPPCEYQYIENSHPPIVSKNLFNEANNKLVNRVIRRGTNEYNGALRGLVICGVCGQPMTPNSVVIGNKRIFVFDCNKKYHRKKCLSRSIRDTKLNLIVLDNIKELINNYVDGEKIVDIVSDQVNKKERLSSKITKLEELIACQKKTIENLYLKKTNNEISLDEFLKKRSDEIANKEKLETELNCLVDEKNLNVKRTEILNDYVDFINNKIFLKDWINKLIESITLYRDNTIQIKYKFGLGETKKIKLY